MPTGISGLYKNTKGAKKSPKTHHVKILPEYFDAVENGTKAFEIRYNDRDYKVGDLLCLEEYRDGAYTGREAVREIGYMIDDPAFCKEGYVVLGLCIKEKRQLNLTLDDAINLLKKEYERARNMEYVRKPLAWALFQVWKKVDKK